MTRIDWQRAADLILAIAGGLVLLPVLAVIAVLVRRGSPGAAIYQGTRAGLHEHPFRQWKFRSMVADADAQGAWFTTAGDPRITPLGAFLRRTSLDELPQLWNVIRGDMSLVGPRPAAIPQLDQYAEEARRLRASVRPGITGLHQVRGRSQVSPERALELDLEWVRRRSPALYVQILAETVLATVLRRGVN